jgi:hypothetical protein
VEGGHPEYHLIEKGYALQSILLAVTHWGQEYKPNPNGRWLNFLDRETQQSNRRMAPTRQDGRSLKHHEVISVL